MNSLLKFFISSSIGYREKCFIPLSIAKVLINEIPNIEEHFHIIIKDGEEIAEIWNLSDWRSSLERLSLIREKSAAEREARLHRKEILASLRSKLLKQNFSEKEIEETILRLNLGELPELAQRLKINS